MSTSPTHPTIYLTRYTHSGEVCQVHQSERSAANAVKRGYRLAVQECVAVPIEQYQAIRALHEIVYALEEYQMIGLVMTPAAMMHLSDDARNLCLARLRESHEKKMGQLWQNLPAPLLSSPAAAEMTASQMIEIPKPDAPDQSAQNQNQAP